MIFDYKEREKIVFNLRLWQIAIQLNIERYNLIIENKKKNLMCTFVLKRWVNNDQFSIFISIEDNLC